MNKAFKVNRYLVLVLLLLSVIASIFWLSSRYPALDQKALMGGESPIEGLGFDNTFDTTPNDSVWQTIFYNTANWVMTNRKGMAFGILFAAALMLLFSLLHERQFKNKFLNSVLGMFIGAPLGVCVNCAAPIAQGMHDSGAKTETTLATMISSPTLNVIVMGIMFSLLPFYMVMIKLVLTFLIILVVIPATVHFFKARKVTNSDLETAEDSIKKSKTSALLLSLAPFNTATSWPHAIKWLVKSYWTSLWHLVKVTVPLMLLAGLLGNVLISVLPWTSILAMIPVNEGIIMTTLVMVIISLIGLFLPVPISFDVIIAAVMLAMGMPEKYVVILLFTLGIFSIYSFFIVWQAISKKIALVLGMSIAILGVCSGWSSTWVSSAFQGDVREKYAQFAKSSSQDWQLTQPKTYPAASFDDSSVSNFDFSPLIEYDKPGSSISAAPFRPNQNTGNGSFEKIAGPAIGIPVKGGFALEDMLEPFAQGKAIASADFNQDGWPDLLFGTKHGIELWKNQEGKGFSQVAIEGTDDISHFITNATFADMNGDGWPDIVFTVYRKGYFLWYNDKGSFSPASLKGLPSPQEAISGTGLSLGDVDHDGDLDIVVGNWSVGWYLDVDNSYQTSNDALLINDNGEFRLEILPGVPGESLSTLITDFDNDGNQDIIICNDYGIPDKYLLGDGTGSFTPVVKADSLFSYTTYFSMSTATADIDNDLSPEIYNTSISGIHLDMAYRSKQPDQICESIEDPAIREECLIATKAYLEMSSHSLNASSPCSDPNDLACTAYRLYWLGKRSKTKEALRAYCEWIPESAKDLYFKTCEFDLAPEPGGKEKLPELISPKRQRNTFFKRNKSGSFDEMSDPYGIKYSGWSWNAKFADLDNDEYQDLLVVNGFVMNVTQHSNLLYLNEQGNSFKDITESSGIKNFSPTNSYVYIDYDLDGDLDILMAPKVGPVLMYKNQLSQGNSIAFRLNDHQGNSQGISARIIISYGNGRQQMRELQAGGGFRSGDDYTTYFGLGEYTEINQVSVIWSTGEETRIDMKLKAGRIYQVTREKDTSSATAPLTPDSEE